MDKVIQFIRCHAEKQWTLHTAYQISTVISTSCISFCCANMCSICHRESDVNSHNISLHFKILLFAYACEKFTWQLMPIFFNFQCLLNFYYTSCIKVGFYCPPKFPLSSFILSQALPVHQLFICILHCPLIFVLFIFLFSIFHKKACFLSPPQCYNFWYQLQKSFFKTQLQLLSSAHKGSSIIVLSRCTLETDILISLSFFILWDPKNKNCGSSDVAEL